MCFSRQTDVSCMFSRRISLVLILYYSMPIFLANSYCICHDSLIRLHLSWFFCHRLPMSMKPTILTEYIIVSIFHDHRGIPKTHNEFHDLKRFLLVELLLKLRTVSALIDSECVAE